jgi:hypothetical protein
LRESYIFYRSFAEGLANVDDATYRRLMDAITWYALDGIEPNLSGLELSLFQAWKANVDASNARRENGAKGAEYGKLGGRPKKGDEKPQEKPQENPIGVIEKTPKNPIGVSPETPNINVNVNVNDNDNENVKKTVKENHNPKGNTQGGKYFPEDLKLDEAFSAFAEMRAKIRKPLTPRAVDLAIAKLRELSSDSSGIMDNDKAIDILNQSTLNSWQGLFPLKEEAKTRGKTAEDIWGTA